MEGLAELGVNLPVLIAQVINVAILFGLLYLVAYKPIIRLLDARSRRIKESMEQAEAIREQVAQTEERVRARLAEANKEGQERIAQAMKIGEELKQKAREEAKQEAEALISRARAEIQAERDEALREVRKEFADLTIMAAEKIIERSLDREAHKELIDKVLEESMKRQKE
jgi:F-type H+-transporting ATPase subunit b